MKRTKLVCHPEDDGSETCKVVEDDGEMPVIRSQVNFSTDPNTCNPRINYQEIQEGDGKKMSEAIKSAVQNCKRGLV